MNEARDTIDAFLADWNKWAQAGAPMNSPVGADYRPYQGLCSCLWDYLYKVQPKMTSDRDADVYWKFRTECKLDLRSRFVARGLDDCYPFGRAEFDRRSQEATMHWDVNRLGFVREELKKAADRKALEEEVKNYMSDEQFDVGSDKAFNWSWLAVFAAILFIAFVSWPVKAKADDTPVLTVAYCWETSNRVYRGDPLSCKVMEYSVDGKDLDYCILIRDAIMNNKTTGLKATCK